MRATRFRRPLSLAAALSAWLLASHPGIAATQTVDPELRSLLIRAVAASDSFPDRFDAEVWLLDMSRRLQHKVADPRYRLELLKHVHYEATRAGLTPELALAVIEVESNFDQYAISTAGARGLMQVMPFWLKEIGTPEDSLFRMQTNLRYGCTILKYYLDKERGNLNIALRRYHGSLADRSYPAKVDRLLRTRWYRH
jgi:soluble lytic murein transglycosylase-like protein